MTIGDGSRNDPWLSKTPSQTSEYQAWRDETLSPARPVVQVGSTQLSYRFRALEGCHQILKAHGDWMALGNADAGKPVQDGTVEAWARDPGNPVGGYCGLRRVIADGSQTM